MPSDPEERKPAQYGREVVWRIGLRGVAALAALALLTPLLGVVIGFGWPFVLIELAAIGAMLAIDRTVSPNLDRRIRGNRGEERVGAILDRLVDSGWRVLHDQSLGRG